jgi:serpin B
VGLDDRLRNAMRRDHDDQREQSAPEVLRRRASLQLWRRRVSLGAAVIVVTVTVSIAVADHGDLRRSPSAALRHGLAHVSADAELAVSSVGRAVPDPTDVKALVAANAQFASDLYHELVKESPGKNLVFSPESISYALAMTYAGARANTAAEIAKALHFDALPATQLHVAFNALTQELLAARKGQDKGRKPLVLSTSNSAWGQRSFPFEQAYLDTLARYYGTGLRLSDFARDAERERQRINAYVAQQTDQRITDLIPPGIIDDLTRLVLVNTITFTADWRFPFVKFKTTTLPFTRLDGSHVHASMMEQGDEQGFDGYQGAHFVAASLPYEGGASMLLIVPDVGQFAAVEQKLDPRLVQQISAGLVGGADVWLPKFDFRSHLDLPTTLRALGVHDAFDPLRADLAGISPSGLYVKDIVHEATITVDENGTKAAAATAVIAEATSGRLVRVTVHADRPFIYLIRDDTTGAILFQGRVLDPTQT